MLTKLITGRVEEEKEMFLSPFLEGQIYAKS